jgi:hypothetical protein
MMSKADHSPPSSGRFKNVWHVTYTGITLLYGFELSHVTVNPRRHEPHKPVLRWNMPKPPSEGDGTNKYHFNVSSFFVPINFAKSQKLFLLRQLTTWSRVLLEKLIVTQLVKKFCTFYGT